MAAPSDVVSGSNLQHPAAVDSGVATGTRCKRDTKGIHVIPGHAYQTRLPRWLLGCNLVGFCVLLLVADVFFFGADRSIFPKWCVPTLGAADCYIGTCLVALTYYSLCRRGQKKDGARPHRVRNGHKGDAGSGDDSRNGSDERAAIQPEQRLNHVVEQTAKKDGVVKAGELIVDFESQKGRVAPVASYESILRACARNGDSETAHWWFSRMVSKGLEASATTYNTVLDACAKADDARGCEAWLERMIERNIGVSVVSFSMAICVRARRGEPELAEAWFQRMRAADIEADAVCYNSLIHARSVQKDVEGAERWAEEMRGLGLVPTATTFTTLMGACAKCGQIQRAELWMERMVEQGVKPNVVSFAAVIDACAKTGDPMRAVHWHEKMVGLGVAPNSHTYASVISAFAQVGDATSAEEWLHRSERDENCDSGDVVVYSSVISACAKAGDAERALAVYHRMRANGIRPHIVAYAALARPFAYKGDWQQVELIAEDMAVDKVVANEYFIYAQLLAYATSKPRQGLRAEACFRDAAVKGVRVNDYIESALARAVGRPRCAELLKEARPDGRRMAAAPPQRGGLAVRREPREGPTK